MTKNYSNMVYQKPEIEELSTSGLKAICAVSANGATIGDVDVIDYGEI